PMIAKIITWDHDRTAALARMANALTEVQVVGVNTNTQLLLALTRHPKFVAGEVDTGFIERFRGDLFPATQAIEDRTLALATMGKLLEREQTSAHAAQGSADRHSPWNRLDGWRLNGDGHDEIQWKHGEEELTVTVHFPRGARQVRLDLPGGTTVADG